MKLLKLVLVSLYLSILFSPSLNHGHEGQPTDQWKEFTCSSPESGLFLSVMVGGCDLASQDNPDCVNALIPDTLKEACTREPNEPGVPYHYTCLINRMYEGDVCCFVRGEPSCVTFPQPIISSTTSSPPDLTTASPSMSSPTPNLSSVRQTPVTDSIPSSNFLSPAPSSQPTNNIAEDSKRTSEGIVGILIPTIIVIVLLTISIIIIIILLLLAARKFKPKAKSMDITVSAGPPPPPLLESDDDDNDSSTEEDEDFKSTKDPGGLRQRPSRHM